MREWSLSHFISTEAQSYRTWKEQGPQASVVMWPLTPLPVGPFSQRSCLWQWLIYLFIFGCDVFRCLDSFTLGNVQLDHRVTVMLIVLHDTPLGPTCHCFSDIPHLPAVWSATQFVQKVDDVIHVGVFTSENKLCKYFLPTGFHLFAVT